MKKQIKLIVLVTLLLQSFAFSGSCEKWTDVMPNIVAIGLNDSLGAWVPWGTGFLMYSYEDTPNILVTNRHVFQPEDPLGQKISLKEVFVKVNFKSKLRTQNILDLNAWIEFHVSLTKQDSLLWTAHSDSTVDIAVIYFPPLDSKHLLLLSLSESLFIPKSFCGYFDSLDIAQDVLFVGFPLGLGTSANPQPIIRGGIIAYLDDTIKSYLLDAQVFGGSSGSPIFTTGTSRGGIPRIKERKLVGIISGFKSSPIRHVLRRSTVPNQNILSNAIDVENAGLAVAYSTDLILEVIEDHHQEMAAKYKAIMDSLGLVK